MAGSPRHLAVLSVFFGLGLLGSGDASAIIIRHDVDDEEYVVDDSEFPALVDLFEPGDCIGTLIHSTYLLTVAHCAEDLRTSDRLTVNGQRYRLDEIMLHPQYDGWDYDIALVRFTEPVTGVSSYPLYRGNEERGSQITIVGRGVHGTGIEGEPGATQDRLLRRATNLVTDVDNQWIEVRFEEPGEDDITALEGVGASGDSGGPAFIETDEGLAIAGLNSWGDGQGSIRVGQYGAYDYSTRVSRHLEWIDDILDLGEDDGPDDPDEPDEGDDTGEPDDPGESEDTGASDSDGVDGGADTDVDSDDLDSEEWDPSLGCGCASRDGTDGWAVLLLVGLLGLRKRTDLP